MAPWTITVSQAQSLAAVSGDKDLSLASSRIYELLSLRRNMVGKQRLACVCVRARACVCQMFLLAISFYSISDNS